MTDLDLITDEELLEKDSKYCSFADTAHYAKVPKIFSKCEGSCTAEPFSLKERTRVPISVDDGSYDQKKLRKSNTLSRFDLPEAL